MAMGNIEAINDIVANTRNNYADGELTQIAQKYQNYIVLPDILKKEGREEDAGVYIERKVLLRTTDTAHNVVPYQTESLQRQDVMGTVKVPPRSIRDGYTYDIMEEFVNRAPAQIVNNIKVQETVMQLNLHNKIEEDFFSKPTSSSDVQKQWGLKYWCVWNATEGFYGGNPSGFSDCGGIDASTQTNHRNWTFQFTDPTYDDLATKVLLAKYKTEWKTPMSSPLEMSATTRPTKRLITNYANYSALATEARKQNDQIGPELGFYQGKVTIGGMYVECAPVLDLDSGNPIFGIDFDSFKPVFVKGNWRMLMKPQPMGPTQPTVWAVFTQYNFNYVVEGKGRRSLWYGRTGAEVLN